MGNEKENYVIMIENEFWYIILFLRSTEPLLSAHSPHNIAQALRLYAQDAAQIWRISLIIILCHGSLSSRQLFIEWHVDNICWTAIKFM